MIPVEKKILQGYDIHDFIICTDSGLSGTDNRKFNNHSGRAFITTVSIKKMPEKDKAWCLSPTGWHLDGETGTTYDITKLEGSEEQKEKYYDAVFYKENYIEYYDEERDISFNQTLLVTFSLKYRYYMAGTPHRADAVCQGWRTERNVSLAGTRLWQPHQGQLLGD